jgi:hypothetical protein
MVLLHREECLNINLKIWGTRFGGLKPNASSKHRLLEFNTMRGLSEPEKIKRVYVMMVTLTILPMKLEIFVGS